MFKVYRQLLVNLSLYVSQFDSIFLGLVDLNWYLNSLLENVNFFIFLC